MKKLILFLFISILLSSCGYAPMTNENPIIITKIIQVDDTFCKYYGEGSLSLTATITSYNFCFKDTTGKFQIGDTINFIKLNK